MALWIRGTLLLPVLSPSTLMHRNTYIADISADSIELLIRLLRELYKVNKKRWIRIVRWNVRKMLLTARVDIELTELLFCKFMRRCSCTNEIQDSTIRFIITQRSRETIAYPDGFTANNRIPGAICRKVFSLQQGIVESLVSKVSQGATVSRAFNYVTYPLL